MRKILVGERVNGWGSNRGVWQRIYDDPQKYFATMIRHEAFRWAPGWEDAQLRCWERLGRVLGDLTLDHTMQLLRPSAICGSWQLDEARRAARSLVTACPRPSLLICCGTRVTSAVYHALKAKNYETTDPGYPTAPGVITGSGSVWFTRIPHPSGRNTKYENRAFIEEIRTRLSDNLELLYAKLEETGDTRHERAQEHPRSRSHDREAERIAGSIPRAS